MPDIPQDVGLDQGDTEEVITWIPKKVIDARRAGLEVTFDCSARQKQNWFWTLPDGGRIYLGY